MTEFATTPPGDLSKVGLEEINPLSWALLREGVANTASSLRFPVLATATSEGVDARVLVLRRVDELHQTLEFHTDKRSAKVRQIKNSPYATWVFYDPARKLQLRVKSTAQLCVGGQALDATWKALSEHTKRAYGQELIPGTPVNEIRHGAPCPHIENAQIGKTNFAVIECKVHEIEWLVLSRTGHQSALLRSTPAGWSSTWIMP